MEFKVRLKSNEEAIGTICFMTYNRGHILLKTIKRLLPRLNHHWPVMVVNNCSSRYTQEYNEIEKTIGDGVKYKSSNKIKGQV